MRDIETIKRDNSDSHRPDETIEIPLAAFERIFTALKISRESLQDVLRHGAGERQIKNIRGTDLPKIEQACESAVAALLNSPKRLEQDHATFAPANVEPEPVGQELRLSCYVDDDDYILVQRRQSGFFDIDLVELGEKVSLWLSAGQADKLARLLLRILNGEPQSPHHFYPKRLRIQRYNHGIDLNADGVSVALTTDDVQLLVEFLTDGRTA